MEIVGAENMMWNGSMDQSQLAWQQRAFADWKIWQNAVYHVKELKRQLETLQINQNLIDEQHSASSSSGGSDSEEEYIYR